MEVRSMTTVLPVETIADAVRSWGSLLGVAPAFVDGERWAQFNIGGSKLALAGPGQGIRRAGLMVRVDDLEASRTEIAGAGLDVSAIQTGPHERFFEALTRDGWQVTFYCPSPA